MSERSAERPDLWIDPEDDAQDGDGATGERAVVLDYLNGYRKTIEMKCDGLDPEQLARRSVPPSTMSLLGLMRHLAMVEHSWHRRVIEGNLDLPKLFKLPDDRDWDFNGAIGTEECASEASHKWRDEVAHAQKLEAALNFDALVDVDGEPHEVRDIMIHLVEEYARHAGHADLLRECIDGRTGQ